MKSDHDLNHIARKLKDGLPKTNFEDEILDYSHKLNGYKMQDNDQVEVAFFGDREDHLNVALDNIEAIKIKYNLNKEIQTFATSNVEVNTSFGGSLIYGYVKKSEKLNLMPYGIYSFTTLGDHYLGFRPIQINLDEYIKFDNSEMENLQTDVINFFNDRLIYEENKTRHKGASLMFGPPGVGKSMAIMNLINSPAFKEMYTIFIPKHMKFGYLEEFKKAFDGHNILIIMEEMTERLSGGTEDILNFLDGYTSWNNCYVIATTNYPELLPANLVDRPGRFNNLIEIKQPTDDQKSFYLKSKGFSEEDIKEILPKTKDFSLDYIAQLSLQSKRKKLPLLTCLKVFETNKAKVKGTFKGKSNIGL